MRTLSGEKKRLAGRMLAEGRDAAEIAEALRIAEEDLPEAASLPEVTRAFEEAIRLRGMMARGQALLTLCGRMRDGDGASALRAMHEALALNTDLLGGDELKIVFDGERDAEEKET